jgi:ATP/maltotriose-dependent transcriptional regulator MalT
LYFSWQLDLSGDETITLKNTKLGPPKIGGDLVTRSRLIDYLMHDPKQSFTLDSAPAGYGKTTLLVQWLTEIDRSAAWLALDKHDSDLAMFLNYLLAVVRTLYPQGVERAFAFAGPRSTAPRSHRGPVHIGGQGCSR